MSKKQTTSVASGARNTKAPRDVKQLRLDALRRIRDRGPIKILDPVAIVREDRNR